MSSFHANYPAPLTDIPRYANLAAFPSAVTAGNGALAIALDTDYLYISNGATWILLASGAVGTVTSVGLSAPAFMTVSGSPVTSAGTLTLTLSGTALPTTSGGTGVTSLGNLTESTSSVLTITGGTGSVINSTSIQVKLAGAAQSGYLSSTDWNTFNNKQAAGSYITALTGDVTATGPGSVAATLAATSNATLVTLSALTTAASLSTVGTISTGTWNATTIGISKGGTGQVTASAAFNALSPITTTGDMIYSASGATNSRLAIGSSGNVLTVSGGVPTWAPPATSGTVTSVAMTVPSFLSVSGSPVTSSGTLAVSLSGTALPTTSGGTGLTSIGTSNQVLGVNNAGTALEYKTISVGTAGTDFAVVLSSANAITFNLPDASATARGAITTGTQTIAGAKTFGGGNLLSSASDAYMLKSTIGNHGVWWDNTGDTVQIFKGGTIYAKFGGSGSTALFPKGATIQDGSDNTKQITFSVSGNTTAKTLTLASAVTLDRTVTFPDATGTLLYSGGPLGTPSSGTLTNATGLTSSGVSTATFTAPTIQRFTSSTGTYTTPTSPRSPLYLIVEMIGGGGGGAGSGTAAGTAAGDGGNTTFGSNTASGGKKGVWAAGPASPVGGAVSVGTGTTLVALQGSTGGPSGENDLLAISAPGGSGGCSPFGGQGGGGGSSGTGDKVGGAAVANSGSGGGGGGTGTTASSWSGTGGGSGGYIRVLVTSPGATYSYGIGAAGTAGAAGTNGSAGGAGGSGIVVVTEFYQ